MTLKRSFESADLKRRYFKDSQIPLRPSKVDNGASALNNFRHLSRTVTT